jgi:hypothetical protein
MIVMTGGNACSVTDCCTHESPIDACPRSERKMKLVISMPKLGRSIPELRILSCGFCGELETKEIE